jgi:hypothetical protein
VLIGTYNTKSGIGPVCQPGIVWTNNAIAQGTDIAIKTLTGTDPGAASAQTISTYDVVRAVAHVESGDNFDAVNG